MSEYLIRFSVRQRTEHLAVMVLFITLSVTGFPQKYYEAWWAQPILTVLGGIDAVRWIHRTAGILFAAFTFVHLITAIGLVATGRSPLTLVPTRRDFTDAIQMLRYYLGTSGEHAHFDRFDYRQKFEYWGLVFGGILMIATGLILYFPIFTTRYLPGEVIPAAKLAHGNEGLMAFLVVILWHIYNAHLSPDVFPFDKSIFTGKISLDRMKHEHPLELARLEESGEIGER
jgi:formate dehydrogenase gamma subunit